MYCSASLAELRIFPSLLTLFHSITYNQLKCDRWTLESNRSHSEQFCETFIVACLGVGNSVTDFITRIVCEVMSIIFESDISWFELFEQVFRKSKQINRRWIRPVILKQLKCSGFLEASSRFGVTSGNASCLSHLFFVFFFKSGRMCTPTWVKIVRPHFDPNVCRSF